MARDHRSQTSQHRGPGRALAILFLGKLMGMRNVKETHKSRKPPRSLNDEGLWAIIAGLGIGLDLPYPTLTTFQPSFPLPTNPKKEIKNWE